MIWPAFWPTNTQPSVSTFAHGTEALTTHLYRSLYPLSSLQEGEPVGVQSITTDDFGTYVANVFGFHLYLMQHNDARALIRSFLFPSSHRNCVIRGDINHDGTAPNISDLVFLVAYMFQEGPEPPSPEEADINGSGGPPDISDLVYLVTYMFQVGPAPVICP